MGENKRKPNLFDFATSELSQDAFIAWLASWADPDYRDACAEMHQLGKRFLISLVPYLENGEIRSVTVKRQFKKIDLVIDVNKKHLIVVEDKTFSGAHSNQLQRYEAVIEDEVKGNGYFPNREPHYIYFKTGDEIERGSEDLSGFKPYRRSDFLKVLENGKEINSDILSDFTNRLREWDCGVNAYKNKPMENWEYDQWTGFFVHLCNHINKKYGTTKNKHPANFRHINNLSGGFQGAWFGFKNPPWNFLELGDNIYFQFEATPIGNGKFRPDLTLRISSKENTREATKRLRDRIEIDGTLDAIKENPFLEKNNMWISQKNLRPGKSIRILSFEGVANSRSVDQIIEVIDTLIKFRRRL